jgi:hypothetical protein
MDSTLQLPFHCHEIHELEDESVTILIFEIEIDEIGVLVFDFFPD